MTWEPEFYGTVPNTRRRVTYETLDGLGYSRAERPDRVAVSGKVVHRGWVSDHKGYELFKSLTTEWYRTEDKGIHNPMCPGRVFHTNPGHVCDPDIPNPFKPKDDDHE